MTLFDLSTFAKKKDHRIKILPRIPDTSWRPRYDFPDLRNASAISFDVETHETDFAHGPGWGRGTGYIVGFSVGAIWPDGHDWRCYFPVRHEVEKHDNLDAGRCFAWLKEQLETSVPKVGANLIYDIGWLTTENIHVQGELQDVQFAEALIDEEALVALDTLGLKYTGRGKNDEQAQAWAVAAYGCAPTLWRGEIWRMPPRLVGYYGEDDAALPLEIIQAQWSSLVAQNLVDLFRMECASIPMIIEMRLPGISIDVDKTERFADEIAKEIPQLYDKIAYRFGARIDSAGSPEQVAKLFDMQGIVYPKTATGHPSFRKEWLKALEHPLGEALNEVREHEKILSTFVRPYLNRQSGGRIHCSFHPLKSDEGGAKTGRYASSDPNLQNVSIRSKLGKRVRELFIPDYGHKQWHKKDHSQIEYRVFAHFACGAGSDELRRTYREDPSTDYHNRTMIRFAEVTGKDLTIMTTDELTTFRKPIKNVNFGLLYGQMEKSLAYKAGMTPEQAKIFFSAYHTAAPYVKDTMAAIQRDVQALGYIETVLGRRVRFDRWQATEWNERRGAVPLDMAIRVHGSNIERAFAYRGVNYKFQGSAADILKAGMLACYKSGVFHYTGMPKLQVHDELDWSQIDDNKPMQDAFAYITHTLENAVKISVPLKVDTSTGANWREAA